MVRLSEALQHGKTRFQRRTFLDSLRIYVKGGAGGMGYPKYGGIGGKGGDVYVEAKESLTLKNVVRKNPEKRFSAGNGGNSRVHRILGERGTDLNVVCPTGVTLYSELGHKLGELDKSGDKVLVARGGSGGCSENQFNGQKGQAYHVVLDLKLIADVGLVGYPNAGKSSLLKIISKATPKIGEYPFTTICPQLGILMYNDYRQISMADLPGLIEGAHRNVGLGHSFLKHIERTKIMLFVIDINGFRLNPNYPHRTPFETVLLLNKELELYRNDLIDKPAILAVNKMDTPHAKKSFEDLLNNLENLQGGLKDWPDEMRPKKLIEYDDIIPVSANTGENIEKLKLRLRKLIDFHADIKRQENPDIKSIDVLLKHRIKSV